MARQKSIEGGNFWVKSDKNHAQILLGVDSEINTLDKAKHIIESFGIHIIEIKNISPQLILLKLSVKDMREIALELIEQGFTNIEGYNAFKS